MDRVSHREVRQPVGTLQCRGQLIDIPPGRYEWVRMTITATADTETEIWLYYSGGLDPEPLWVPTGTSRVRVGVARRDDLLRIRLPRTGQLIVKELTLVTPPPAAREGDQ
jgi:hypothetical protein